MGSRVGFKTMQKLIFTNPKDQYPFLYEIIWEIIFWTKILRKKCHLPTRVLIFQYILLFVANWYGKIVISQALEILQNCYISFWNCHDKYDILRYNTHMYYKYWRSCDCFSNRYEILVICFLLLLFLVNQPTSVSQLIISWDSLV